VGKPERKKIKGGKPGHKWKDNIKMHLQRKRIGGCELN
jgi:hypothetical protein